MKPVDLYELLVQDRQVGAVVAHRSVVVLKPRQLELVEDAQAIESKDARLSLAEMQDRRNKRHLTIENLVEGVSERAITGEIVNGALGVELRVPPIDDAAVRDVDQVIPWI